MAPRALSLARRYRPRRRCARVRSELECLRFHSRGALGGTVTVRGIVPAHADNACSNCAVHAVAGHHATLRVQAQSVLQSEAQLQQWVESTRDRLGYGRWSDPAEARAARAGCDQLRLNVTGDVRRGVASGPIAAKQGRCHAVGLAQSMQRVDVTRAIRVSHVADSKTR